MTESHDDRTPVEHDPTGMRALLASLPEPGPMPDDLVARITAALAAEAGTGAPASGTATPRAGSSRSTASADAVTPSATVVPLPRRRVRLRHLGVAAAVVGALGLGGLVLTTVPDSLTASIGAAGGSADSARDAEGSTGQGGGSGADSPAVGRLPAAGSGEVVVVMSGRAYTVTGLAEGARALAADPGAPLPSLAAESPGLGPIATPLGARSCAGALGVPATAGVLVDLAEVDGRPAAVLVVDDGTGLEAYAVDRSCTTGTTGLIGGPVTVD